MNQKRPQTDALSSAQLFAQIEGEVTRLRRLSGNVPRPELAGRVRPQSIVVTGATGFLGVHLLARLVSSEAFESVTAVVRDASKLTKQLERYCLSLSTVDRIKVVTGDLATMDLADLPDADVVLHGAASIHGLHPLSRLWKDNVETTLRVCERYAPAAGTRLVFVSSLSVFVSSNCTGVHSPESLSPSEKYQLVGGYAQSKFIGEKLIEACGGDIVRPGLLTGSSFLGKFPDRDFFTLFLQTVHQLGVYPDNYVEAFVDVTPVDFAAEQLAEILQPQPADTSIWHLANTQSVPLSDILGELRALPVSREVFFEKLRALPRLTQVLLTYAFFKPEALAELPQYFNVDLFQSTDHAYSVSKNFAMSNAELLAKYASVNL